MYQNRKTTRKLLIEMNPGKDGGGLEEWNIADKLPEEPVGDCHDLDNDELDEAQVDNDLE